MGKLLPVIIAIVGLLAGAGAGYFLRPAPEPEVLAEGEAGAEDAPEADKKAASKASGDKADAERDYVKLNNQFVIPVVRSGRVASLVVMSLSIEVTTGSTELVFKNEPKLRDVFLQVMFDHANAGGFDGAFTETGTMTMLRRALLEAASQVIGSRARDILITDIVRQDA
ncbi:flagellar basal body-associated FliL family protein [Rhodovulum tesquicola]|uniref:flagellar basal body-associated FliL family protein n=1 Tax=Rhodovulum tesquicola TaxID=540254 RepID=UPI002097491E|nr:flagellar basal body-associated FliL family protein [Rhodovulum tesquicola]MCO8143801.1 flagellar basal body-associated FliL family protein [Rhodovulum tesquicola]